MSLFKQCFCCVKNEIYSIFNIILKYIFLSVLQFLIGSASEQLCEGVEHVITTPLILLLGKRYWFGNSFIILPFLPFSHAPVILNF